jgi:hypothetical protein
MGKPKTCTGSVLVEKHQGDPSYEIVSVHFADGGAAVTIGDLLARLGIAAKDRDRLRIAISRLPSARAKRKVLP